ncbi:hypothetical protein TrLO_g1228 [Triparma laevis f. longispina]|uniref:SAP domain-containing protein n=1 Tax=Triparma laevis f. longispina TaxID=1714387 RepID=A0A9W7EIZ7_9STRA|nr:hypothetical protein TrLO_g1228 [Triparma laevis f. longispina]
MWANAPRHLSLTRLPLFNAITFQCRRSIGSNQVDLTKPWGRKAYELVEDVKPFHPDHIDAGPLGVSKLQPDDAVGAKNNVKDMDDGPSNDQYLDAMAKATSGPQSNVKLVEEELQEEVAAALNKQATKVLMAIEKAQVLRSKVESELAELKSLKVPELKALCKELNVAVRGKKDDLVKRCLSTEKLLDFETTRKAAYHARWELGIHRQACGFVTNNQQFIETHYKIPEKIDLFEEEKKEGKVFTDQLDWWQSKGRWR